MSVIHKDGFSSAVRIFLEINGQVMRVAQVGEGSLILRDQGSVEPNAEARIIITVDHNRRVYPVVISSVNGRWVYFDDYVYA
jgi:hypothetical protein